MTWGNMSDMGTISEDSTSVLYSDKAKNCREDRGDIWRTTRQTARLWYKGMMAAGQPGVEHTEERSK